MSKSTLKRYKKNKRCYIAIFKLTEKIYLLIEQSKKLTQKNLKPRQNWITQGIVISCNKKKTTQIIYIKSQ